MQAKTNMLANDNQPVYPAVMLHAGHQFFVQLLNFLIIISFQFQIYQIIAEDVAL